MNPSDYVPKMVEAYADLLAAETATINTTTARMEKCTGLRETPGGFWFTYNEVRQFVPMGRIRVIFIDSPDPDQPF